MILVNKLPHFVYLNGERFNINVDFRKMVLFEMTMQDNKLAKEDKILKGLRLLYPAFFDISNLSDLPPILIKEASDKLVWFYKCGRDDEVKSKGKSNSKQIYSYEHDDEYIYGAFMECYNIDLNNIKLHWWKFKAMMKSLNSKCEFVKIKGYRAYKGKEKDLIELRNYYAIPLSNEEQERINKLEDMLK